ncbi:hypothetical protein JB92DRAFT_2836197 [Gautieria morchelliformis]|nr:hypothetical protein JB92DRAFT_2836197 [Gautieria morchelliformis]
MSDTYIGKTLIYQLGDVYCHESRGNLDTSQIDEPSSTQAGAMNSNRLRHYVDVDDHHMLLKKRAVANKQADDNGIARDCNMVMFSLRCDQHRAEGGILGGALKKAPRDHHAKMDNKRTWVVASPWFRNSGAVVTRKKLWSTQQTKPLRSIYGNVTSGPPKALRVRGVLTYVMCVSNSHTL